MVELIGFVGGIAFGICLLPQIIKAIKTKSTDDISWFMIILNYIGNICMLSYVILIDKVTAVFLFDYLGAFSLGLILTILKLKYDRR